METPELPEVFTREQARAAGLSDDQIDRRLSDGRFERLHHGVLRHSIVRDRTQKSSTATRLAVPPELAAGLLACGSRDVVVSHASAARLLGLPNPLDGWGRPQVTATSGSGHDRNGVHIRVSPLATAEVFEFRGVAVTRPMRTVLDCLRTLPPRDGLAILDAALRKEWFTLDQLFTRAGRQHRWPGMAQARAVMALGNGRRESPLESWSAWAFHEAGLVAPQWQMDVRDAQGVFVGRVDGWWWGVAGEADGRSKYALAAAERGGADAKRLFQILEAERKREKGLHDCGVEVVRWSTPDLLQSQRLDRLVHRIRSAIAYAEQSQRFTGSVAPYVPPTVRDPRRDR